MYYKWTIRKLYINITSETKRIALNNKIIYYLIYIKLKI